VAALAAADPDAAARAMRDHILNSQRRFAQD
jgi:DNA-binding FadR family transcriptional regulator